MCKQLTYTFLYANRNASTCIFNNLCGSVALIGKLSNDQSTKLKQNTKQQTHNFEYSQESLKFKTKYIYIYAPTVVDQRQAGAPDRLPCLLHANFCPY